MRCAVLLLSNRAQVLVLAVWVWCGLLAAQTQESQVQQYIDEALTIDTQQASEADLRRALALYTAAIKLDPDRVDALVNAGQIYIQREEYKKARTLFTRAVRSARTRYKDQPEIEAQALTGLGICYQKEGKTQEALKIYRLAKQKHRPFVDAHYNLINLLIFEKQFDEVATALAEAEEVAPSPSYRKFHSWLKGKEGSKIRSDLGLQIIIIGLVGGILLTLVLKKLRRQNTPRVRVTGKPRRKARRSSRPPDRRV